MNNAPGRSPTRRNDPDLTRDRPVEPATTALLIVDVQNGTFNEAQQAIRPEFFAAARDVVIPNLQRLVAASRRAGVEVIYTVIENLTRDGRDRSLDYKLTGFSFGKGSWEAKVLDAIAPGEDEIVIPKTSSSLFNSTNADYLLRNIGITDLVVTGFLTDQCIDHTVKDGADRGYYVTCLTDACMANTHARHAEALAMFAGYCRQMTSAAWLAMAEAAG